MALDLWTEPKSHYMTRYPRVIASVAFACLAFLCASIAYAAPHFVGSKKCRECHEAEYTVWEGSEHHKGFNAVHKKPEAKNIQKAAGVTSMKSDAPCVLCHYT
ncbi:MAG: multiheme c-type cytochrome, partial [Burkholderiales bacterium]